MGRNVEFNTHLQAGNHAAWRKIFEESSPQLSKIAERIAPGQGEDVVQTTFAHCWDVRKNIDPQNDTFGWLGKSATNKAKDALRSSESRHHAGYWVTENQLPLDGVASQGVHNIDAIISSPPAEDLVIRREKIAAVRNALTGLPENQRKALELVGEGFSQGEIADMLERPLGSVKTSIRIGQQKLRAVLAEYKE